MSELYLRIMGGLKKEETEAITIIKEALELHKYRITEDHPATCMILFKKEFITPEIQSKRKK